MTEPSQFLMDEDEDLSSIDALMDSTPNAYYGTQKLTVGIEEDAISGIPYSRLEEVDEFRHKLPFSPTWKDRCCYPFKSVRTYFKRLIHTFGWSFIGFLIITQLGLKGALYTLTGSAFLPIFKKLGMDAASLQLYGTLAAAPWALKPLAGSISDIFPIGGYHKRYWLLQAILIGVLGSSCLVLGYRSGVAILIVCFVAINYEMSIADLMSEGKYSEIMRENPASGSDIVTFVKGCQSIGSIGALAVVGPMADRDMFVGLFVIAMILCVLPIIPTILGWLPETKRTLDEVGIKGSRCCMFDLSTFRSEKGVFIIVAITGLGGPFLAAITTYAHKWIGIVCAAVFLVVVVVGSYKMFPRIVANVALYQVISRVSRPSIGSAMDFFYTADATCLPGGPGFSYEYYVTYTGILGAVVALLTVPLYQISMSKWRFRTVVLVTLVMSCLGGTGDLIIVMRWNIAMGIPDKTFYVIGEAVLENVVDMLYSIPTFAIIAKVCPKGAEAATFAFLAGIYNLSGMVSGLLGAVIFEMAGVKTVAPNCDFGPLWILVITCHILVPLVIGIPNSWLIPNSYQTDQLVDGHVAGTEEIEQEEEEELQPSTGWCGSEEEAEMITLDLNAHGLWSEDLLVDQI